MTHKEVEDYLMSLPDVWLDYPFGKDVAVYKIGEKAGEGDDEDGRAGGKGAGKMFALVAEGKEPVQISLKCEPQLGQVLRERYESVMPGYHLNKKHWNTVVLTGQLSWEEVQDLIRHSYDLVAG